METLGSTDHASGAADPRRPRLSVIVPVRDGAPFLAESLPALRASDLPGEAWELVVVDDASRDGSADVAARFADVVLRQPESRGPAAARNRGVRHSRGDILVFIDADVSVHGDTLRRLDNAFHADAGIAGVFGAYDAAPRARGLVSQYRNLLHHRIHTQARGEAETFWAGLGAIRRWVLVAAGEFDETMRQLEDIDLGYRVRARGHRILLRPEIQGTHLKPWTLRSMVVTDLFGRGVTWMRLHLAQGRTGRPGTLNLRPAEKLLTLLTGAAAVALGVGLIRQQPLWLIASGLCLASVIAGNLPLLRWFARERGLRFAFLVVPLRLLYYLLNVIAAGIGCLQHIVALRRRPASSAPAPPEEPTAG
jgi:cellulose synthase/poly-beta-1,6-N-acetylglucosamine synthase-like glycosyltransferase